MPSASYSKNKSRKKKGNWLLLIHLVPEVDLVQSAKTYQKVDS